MYFWREGGGDPVLSRVVRVVRCALCVCLSIDIKCVILFSTTSRFFGRGGCPTAAIQRHFVVLIPTCGRSTIVRTYIASILHRACPTRLCSLVIVSSRVHPRAGTSLHGRHVNLVRLRRGRDSGTGTLHVTTRAVASRPCSCILVLSTSGLVSPYCLRRLGGTISRNVGTVRARHGTGGVGASVTLLSTTVRRVGGSVFHGKRVQLKFSSTLANSKVTFSFQ